MDVNIRLTIEPAAFFNVSLLPDSNKITSRSSKTVRTHSLSPSRGLSRRKTRDDREPRVTTARITRAPADRKLPLIATQTFILHPEHPRLSLSLSLYVFRLNPSPLRLIGFRLIIRPSFHDLQKQTPLCRVQLDLVADRYTDLHDRSGFVHSERIRWFDGRHASMRYFPSAIETPSASIRGSVTITRSRELYDSVLLL